MKKRDKIEGWNIVRGSEASQCWLKNRHNLRCDSNLTSSKILQSGNCQILFFTEEKMRYALYLSTMYYGEYGLMGAQLPILLSLFFPYVFFFFYLWLIIFDQSTNLTDPHDVQMAPTTHSSLPWPTPQFLHPKCGAALDYHKFLSFYIN